MGQRDGRPGTSNVLNESAAGASNGASSSPMLVRKAPLGQHGGANAFAHVGHSLRALLAAGWHSQGCLARPLGAPPVTVSERDVAVNGTLPVGRGEVDLREHGPARA